MRVAVTLLIIDKRRNILEAASTESTKYAGTRLETDRLLPLISALWLLNSALGAAVVIREDLPGEFAGMNRWHHPSSGFLTGGGTTLSPGLPMMAAQTIFTASSMCDGRAGPVGVAGMTALGAGATIGVLGEPITYEALPEDVRSDQSRDRIGGHHPVDDSPRCEAAAHTEEQKVKRCFGKGGS